MLSLHKFPPRRATFAHGFLRHGRRALPSNKRTFVTELGTEFLDLALALPIPASWPTYSTGIIIVTLATRFALLPVSIWGKRKSRIIEDKVIPTLQAEKASVQLRVMDEMRKAGMKGEKEELKRHWTKETSKVLTARRDELYKKYGCQPWKTMVFPVVAQLPPFFIITVMLRQLSEYPTPFDSESFLTLTTLAHPDPTMALPIVLGLVTMANVETSNMLMTATQRAAMEAGEKRKQEAREKNVRVIEPGKILKTALRGLSVFRILVAAVMPGSVTLYWLTSATFGLFQTWVMDWSDYRRRKAIEAAKPPPLPQATLGKGLGKGPIIRPPADFKL